MPVMDGPLAEKLRAFVHGGGVLLVTARSAARDRNNQVIADTPPGLLADLCGLTVEEFGRLGEAETLTFTLGESRLSAGGAYEVLARRGGQEAGRWLDHPDGGCCAAAGEPAAVLNRGGAGVAVYVGTYLAEANARGIVGFALTFTTLSPLAGCDDFVEVTRRRSAEGSFLFVLNHYPAPKRAAGLPAGTELLTGNACDGELDLEGFEVAVIAEPT